MTQQLRFLSKKVCRALGLQCSLCHSPISSWVYCCEACGTNLHKLRLNIDLNVPALFRYDGILPVLISALRREEFQAPQRIFWQHLLESRYLDSFSKIDAVTLVPTNSKKKQEGLRSMGEAIARSVGAELFPDLIFKTIQRSQHDYGAEDRLDAPFMIRLKSEQRIKGKTVLCIDDVITSGTSMDQSVFAIRKAGAREVRPLALAFTDLQFLQKKNQMPGATPSA